MLGCHEKIHDAPAFLIAKKEEHKLNLIYNVITTITPKEVALCSLKIIQENLWI